MRYFVYFLKKRLRWVYNFIDSFGKQLSADAVYAFAAQSAFFIIIAFFPFIMLVLTVIKLLPEKSGDLQDILYSVLPGNTSVFIADVMGDIQKNASGTLVSLTALTTLWSASSGVYSLNQGISAVYKERETRSYVRLKARSVIYTIVFIFMLVTTMGILVFGRTIQEHIIAQIPDLMGITALIISMRTIVGILVLTIFFLVLYVTVPNRKTKAKYELPGALVSAVGWVVFSYGYSFYINNFSGSSKFYGSMTAIVFLMLWLNFCMTIMLIGAELNVYFRDKFAK